MPTINEAIRLLTNMIPQSKLGGDTNLVLSLSDSGLEVVSVDELALINDDDGAVVEVRVSHPALTECHRSCCGGVVSWITIDDDDTFEGTLEQFKDCFFDNANRVTIKAWAVAHGYKVEFKDEPVHGRKSWVLA